MAQSVKHPTFDCGSGPDLRVVRSSPDRMDQGSTVKTSFNLHYLLKGPVSKYSHIGD